MVQVHTLQGSRYIHDLKRVNAHTLKALRYIPELGLELGAGGVTAARQFAYRELRDHGHGVPAFTREQVPPGQEWERVSRIDQTGDTQREEISREGTTTPTQNITNTSFTTARLAKEVFFDNEAFGEGKGSK